MQTFPGAPGRRPGVRARPRLEELEDRATPAQYGISTAAGTGTAGFAGDGGPAPAAQLFQPSGVAADAAGDLFIADQVNNRVRRVDGRTGVISTYAGTGTAGFAGDGGPAVAAELNGPYGVAADAAGNLFIGDYGNQRVRRVDFATGVITTVAGDGTIGAPGDGGPATLATIGGPRGVAVDAAGDLFIADFVGNTVRRVDAGTQIITTVVGDGTQGSGGDGGPATAAQLDRPDGVAVDPAGDLFVTDSGAPTVRRVDAGTGVITRFAGTTGVGGSAGDGGPAASAQLYVPDGVAVGPAGDVFIADAVNATVRRVDAQTGVITTVAGGGPTSTPPPAGSPATAAQLNQPAGLGFDAAGNLFVADLGDNEVRELTPVVVVLSPAALPGGQVGVGYSQTVSAGGGTAPYTFSFNGGVPPGLGTDPAGTLTGTPTAAGAFTFSVTAVDARGFSGRRVYTLAVSPPVSPPPGTPPAPIALAPASLPAGRPGVPYSQPLSAAGGAGGPYTFRVTAGALPAGLSLSPGGVIGGTPAAGGVSAFVVTATDPAGATGALGYQLAVGAPGAISLPPGPLPAGVAGVPYGQTLSAAGGTAPYSFLVTAGALPAGLSLSPTGVLSGTPAAGGTVTLQITAVDAAGVTGGQLYRLVIGQPGTASAGSQIITFPSLPGPVVYGAAPVPLGATGGGSGNPVTFAVVSGPGVVVGNTLRITGAGTIEVEADQAGDAAFAPAFSVLQDLLVTKAMLTVTATDLTAVVGDPLPKLGYTVTGLVNGDSAAVVNGVNVTTPAGPDSPAGLYPVVVSGGAAGNYAVTFVTGTLTLAAPAALLGQELTAVGSPNGTVTLLYPDGSVANTLTPFPGYTGDVRTAVGGDGFLVVGTGPGVPSEVKVFDPLTGAVLLDFAPFEPTFTGGVYVSTGFLFGAPGAVAPAAVTAGVRPAAAAAGVPDIIISADVGGGPRVQVRNGTTGDVEVDFLGIDDANFRGGARVANADINGDGVPDLLVAAGVGGGPRVTIYDGAAMRAGKMKVLNNFFVFEQSLRNGAYVTAGDVNGDGAADLIVGGGPGGGPRVLIFSGKDVGAGNVGPAVLGNFFAGDPANRGGVRIAVKNLDGDGRADLVTAPGPAGGTKVTAYLGRYIGASGTPPVLSHFTFDVTAANAFSNGAFVG